MDVQAVFLKHVCPGLGAVIAFLLFTSPLKSVLEVDRAKQLGEINALPFVAMLGNCISWILYGFLNHDFYVYCANIPGMILGSFYVFTCYKYSKEQAQDTLRNLFLCIVALYLAIGLADMAAPLDFQGQQKLWGSTAVGVLAVYYAAPLTTVAKVVAQRDSSSLHWPLCTMNTINGMLWFAYGLAIKDWFICLPNGIGAVFNVICLVLCFIFPAKSGRSTTGSSSSSRRNLPGAIDPSSQFAAVRLQSVRHYPAANGSSGDGAGSSSSGGGGFFDLTQFRWRNSPGDFFQRLGSRLSFRQNSQSFTVSNSGLTGLEAVMQHSATTTGVELGDDVNGKRQLGALMSVKEVDPTADDSLQGRDKIPVGVGAVGVGDVEQGAVVHAVSGSAAARTAPANFTTSAASKEDCL